MQIFLETERLTQPDMAATLFRMPTFLAEKKKLPQEKAALSFLSKGFSFTYESLIDNRLWFLDLQLHFMTSMSAKTNSFERGSFPVSKSGNSLQLAIVLPSISKSFHSRAKHFHWCSFRLVHFHHWQSALWNGLRIMSVTTGNLDALWERPLFLRYICYPTKLSPALTFQLSFPLPTGCQSPWLCKKKSDKRREWLR